MRKVVLGGLCTSMLLTLTGCVTVATMVVKHEAMKEGAKVAKSAYEGVKGDSADHQADAASPRE